MLITNRIFTHPKLITLEDDISTSSFLSQLIAVTSNKIYYKLDENMILGVEDPSPSINCENYLVAASREI